MKVKVSSKFVVVGVDVKDGDLIGFTNEGEEVDSTFKDSDGKPKKKTQIGVELPDGDTKTLSLNNTSKLNMIEVYGDDTRDWIGKQARVNVAKQFVGKEMKNVLVLTRPDKDAEGNVIME